MTNLDKQLEELISERNAFEAVNHGVMTGQQ